MTEASIKVVLSKEDAQRKLAELEGSLEEAREEAERLDAATKKGAEAAVRRPSGSGSPGGGSSLAGAAGKAFAAASAVVIAAKVAEAVTSALSQKLDQLGLAGAGQSLREASEKVTAISSAIDQARAGVAGIIQSADPFAQAGLNAEAAQAGLVGRRVAQTRALEEARYARHRLGRGILVYGGLVKDTVAKALSSSF